MPELKNIQQSRINASDHDDRVLKQFTGYFKPFRPVIVLIILTMIIVAIADTAVALGSGLLMELFIGINQAVSSGNEFAVTFKRVLAGFTLYDFTIDGLDSAGQLLWIIALGTLLVVIVKGAVHFTKEYMMWGVTNKILMKLKSELFDRIIHLPLSFFDREKSGDALSRITYDMVLMENSFRSTFILAKSVVYGLIFITAMFLMEWSLTLIVLAVFPLSGLIIKVFGDRIRRISRNVSLNVADYTSFLSEAISGAKIIKAFGREQDKQGVFDRKIRENYRYSMKIAKLGTLHAPAQDIFASLGMVGVILFCGYRMLSGGMTVGDLTAFIVLMVNAYKPIKTLGESNVILQRAMASGKRIFNLLEQPDESQVIGSNGRKLSKVEGRITYRSVRFAYHEHIPVLNGIDLDIQPGETLALVGPSGGGKTTLVSLIPRFYPLTEGKIELDGINTSELSIEFLRSVIAIVPQETMLFSGTVEDNILLSSPDASHEEVVSAAEAANAHGFITELDGGYNAEVGERGVQLSGGQRQRIALARAILRDPRILLLDEATSSLDSDSERLIQQALEEFQRDRTTIIIAHRLSTIQSADRIAVIDGGRLAEIGTHEELFSQDGLYCKLYNQQFTGGV